VGTVLEIESAISKLSREDLFALREWFKEFDADAWEKQFEQDVKAGRLDALGDKALQDMREGRYTEL
jgi:hypothetical protein